MPVSQPSVDPALPDTDLDEKTYRRELDVALRRLFVGLAQAIEPLQRYKTDGQILTCDPDEAGSVAWETATSTASPGNKNKLLNGGFEIQQYGESMSAVAVSATSGFALDRWSYSVATAASWFFTQPAAGRDGSQFCLRMRKGSFTAQQDGFIYQDLETVNSVPLQGKTVTLSFYARAGAGYTLANPLVSHIETGTGTDQARRAGAYTGTVDTSQNNTLTTSWARYSMSLLIPTSATQIGVWFSLTGVNVFSAAIFVELDDVQLEVAAAASDYQSRTFAEEYDLCQRYFWKTFPYATLPAQNAATRLGCISYLVATAGTAGDGRVMVYFPTKMRIAPTITFYNPNAVAATWRNGGANSAAGASDNVANGSFAADNVQVAGDAVGNTLNIHASASAEI